MLNLPSSAMPKRISIPTPHRSKETPYSVSSHAGLKGLCYIDITPHFLPILIFLKKFQVHYEN